MIRNLLKLIGILVLCFIVYIIYQSFFQPVRLQKLSLSALDGRQIVLDSVLNDKLTVLNFWATWCKPCIQEMPMLDSVYQKMDKDKWQILLISDEPVEKIEAFRSRKTFQLPFVKLDQKIGEIGISALPKTLIVDQKMKVLYTKTGGLTMGAEGFLEMLKKYE